jgi:hypothetical protein
MLGVGLQRRRRFGLGQPAPECGGDLVRLLGRCFHVGPFRRPPGHTRVPPAVSHRPVGHSGAAKVSGLPRSKVPSADVRPRPCQATDMERLPVRGSRLSRTAARTGASSPADRGIRPQPPTRGELQLRGHGRRLRTLGPGQPTPKPYGEVVGVAGERLRPICVLLPHATTLDSGRARIEAADRPIRAANGVPVLGRMTVLPSRPRTRTEAPMLKEVTCLCGWVARGTDDEVVEQLTLHAWKDHGVRKTREEILAGAVPIGPADASGA